MSLPYRNAIILKCERAFRSYLRSAPLTNWTASQILCGITNVRRLVPSVVCICHKAEPETLVLEPGGNYWADVEVRINWQSMVDQTSYLEVTEDQQRDLMETAVAKIFGYLASGLTLAQDISDSLDYFTALFIQRGPQDFRHEGNLWIYSESFRVCCCGSDIP